MEGSPTSPTSPRRVKKRVIRRKRPKSARSTKSSSTADPAPTPRSFQDPAARSITPTSNGAPDALASPQRGIRTRSMQAMKSPKGPYRAPLLRVINEQSVKNAGDITFWIPRSMVEEIEFKLDSTGQFLRRKGKRDFQWPVEGVSRSGDALVAVNGVNALAKANFPLLLQELGAPRQECYEMTFRLRTVVKGYAPPLKDVYMRDTPDGDRIVEGYMKKQGRHGRANDDWESRYFVLSVKRQVLSRHSEAPARKDNRTRWIDLTEITSITESVQQPDSVRPQAAVRFAIQHKNGDSMTFETSTPEDCRVWVAALCEATGLAKLTEAAPQPLVGNDPEDSKVQERPQQPAAAQPAAPPAARPTSPQTPGGVVTATSPTEQNKKLTTRQHSARALSSALAGAGKAVEAALVATAVSSPRGSTNGVGPAPSSPAASPVFQREEEETLQSSGGGGGNRERPRTATQPTTRKTERQNNARPKSASVGRKPRRVRSKKRMKKRSKSAEMTLQGGERESVLLYEKVEILLKPDLLKRRIDWRDGPRALLPKRTLHLGLCYSEDGQVQVLESYRAPLSADVTTLPTAREMRSMLPRQLTALARRVNLPVYAFAVQEIEPVEKPSEHGNEVVGEGDAVTVTKAQLFQERVARQIEEQNMSEENFEQEKEEDLRKVTRAVKQRAMGGGKRPASAGPTSRRRRKDPLTAPAYEPVRGSRSDVMVGDIILAIDGHTIMDRTIGEVAYLLMARSQHTGTWVRVARPCRQMTRDELDDLLEEHGYSANSNVRRAIRGGEESKEEADTVEEEDIVPYDENDAEPPAAVSSQPPQSAPEPFTQTQTQPKKEQTRRLSLDRSQSPFNQPDESDEFDRFPGEDDFVDGQHGVVDYDEDQEGVPSPGADQFLSEYGERYGGVYGEDFDEEDEREVTFEEAAEAVGGMVAAQSAGRAPMEGHNHSLGLDMTSALTEETRKYLEASQEDLDDLSLSQVHSPTSSPNGSQHLDTSISPSHKFHIGHHPGDKAVAPGHSAHPNHINEDARVLRREEAKAERQARLKAIQEFYNRNPSLKK